MINRTLIIIGISIIIAGLFTFLAFKWLNSLRNLQQQQKPSMPINVLVATTDMQPRQRIRSTNVQWQPYPDQRLSPNLINQRTHRIEDVIGASVLTPIKKGQPITMQNVILTKDFDSYSLADLIQPGMRAVSVDIDPTSRLAKYVKTGDYVDIMLTTPSVPAKTVTILHGSYVLAVNNGGSGASSDSSNSSSSCASGSCPDKSCPSGSCPFSSRKTKTVTQSVASNNCTLTLEVTPEQAEFLTSVENSGSLTISLYSSNLIQPPENWHTPIIFKQVIPKEAEKQPLVLIKGSKVKEITW
ncbi:MAG: hypothetical protein AMJ43_05470 [Coxiella sp. DG_40]|nr:MAG: hypothetical protein AMJ43_05470 [Coxiella sp. DG_40]